MRDLVRKTYSHKALADEMVMNPWITANELAVMFGVTPNWINRVRSSGMFREMLYARHAEVMDPILKETIEGRAESLVQRSFEILMEKISKPAEEVPDELALQAAQLGAKAIGMGGFGKAVAPPPAPRPTDWLERAGERLRQLNSSEVIDVQSSPVSQARPEGAA